MSIAAIIVGLILAFIAWRLVAGLAKFAVLAIIVAVVLYFVSQGGLA